MKQFLEETRQQLWNMVRIVNILDDRLVELFMISDTSYIWQIIDQFVPLMQVSCILFFFSHLELTCLTHFFFFFFFERG